MPNGHARFDVEKGDRDRVVNFIVETETFLDELVHGAHGAVFYPDLERDIVSAWSEGQVHFLELRNRARDNVEEGALKWHGLTGSQLSLKLRVVEFFWQRFLANDRALTWLEKLLKAINTTLKSILDAVGAGTAATEIKEMIEHCLKEED